MSYFLFSAHRPELDACLFKGELADGTLGVTLSQ